MLTSQRLPQVLVCDDDTSFHLAIKSALKSKWNCRSAYHGDEALAILKNQSVDVLILDVQMRSDDEGLKYISKFLEVEPGLAIVMNSGRTDYATVREAMRLGAVDFVSKSFESEELALTLERVMSRKRLAQKSEQRGHEVSAQQKQHVLVGESPAILQLRRTIEKLRESDVNIVITGETGTGKEVVARQLRRILPDGTPAPFRAIDSSTIQSTTAESTLFGHEKGAFTGADKTTTGLFEEADGGIVYFDEIGNMPLDIQAKLLRVLQEKEVTRLGSSKVLKLDFRVVAATNRSLQEMASKGDFKDDLLQRLNVVPIALPALRERREDIPLLIQHFVSRQRGWAGELTFSEEAVALLQAYDWPGNIRELGNLVAYLTAMADQPEIDVSDLPPKLRDDAGRALRTGSSQPLAAGGTEGGTFYDQVGRVEKSILGAAYERTQGNISRLAMELGMDRSHLYVKLKEHGLHQPRSKPTPRAQVASSPGPGQPQLQA